MTSTQPKPTPTITLSELCQEHALEPKMARVMLRLALEDKKAYPNLSKDRKPRDEWKWNKGSLAYNEALLALKPILKAKKA